LKNKAIAFIFCILNSIVYAQNIITPSTDSLQFKNQIGVNTNIFLNSNFISTKNYTKYGFGSKIDNALKTNIINDLKDKNYFGFGYKIAAELKNKNWIFKYSFQNQLGGNVSKNAIQFALLGNQAFENQEIDLGKSNIKNLTFQKICFGYEFNFLKNKLQVKPQIGLYQILNYQHYFSEKLAIFTASGGEYITAKTDFEIQSANKNGYGLGLSLNTNYKISKNTIVNIDIQDVGFFGLNTRQRISKGNQQFSGVDIGNVANLATNTFDAFNSLKIDSIAGIKSSNSNLNLKLPSYFQMIFNKKIKAFDLKLGAGYQSGFGNRAQIFAGGDYHLNNKCKIGFLVIEGGYSSFASQLNIQYLCCKKHLILFNINGVERFPVANINLNKGAQLRYMFLF